MISWEMDLDMSVSTVAYVVRKCGARVVSVDDWGCKASTASFVGLPGFVRGWEDVMRFDRFYMVIRYMVCFLSLYVDC